MANLFEPVSVEWSLYRKRSSDITQPSGEPEPARELSHHKAYLEEELRIANRKIASMAEELEIANEELRGSNAELRSVNEELAVTNDELQHKVKALNATNHDLTTLITTIDLAVVFLDADLDIRRFTATAARLLKLALNNVGRSLSDVASELTHQYRDDVRRVIATLAPSEREIRSETGRWYLRRVLPYMANERALGAALTWVDITQAKSLQEEVSNIAALEQQRIGQELHDGSMQELTGLALLAQNLSDSLAREGRRSGERELADRLARGIGEANWHVRSLARGLVPVPIDADSLAPALAELARSTRETFGIACDFELLGQASVNDAGTATHLNRIAQEAVRNATSHSKADRISIRLGSNDGDLLLEVRDNGIGISDRTQMHQGVGLRLMEHRCSLMGARFIVEPQPGGGTVVACILPAAEARSLA
jgi:signal transduction histidine kinase